MSFLAFSLARFCATHREFIVGVLAGSLAELLIIYASRWTWDRWLWLRWFSHQ
jgi:hypothetical protein